MTVAATVTVMLMMNTYYDEDNELAVHVYCMSLLHVNTQTSIQYIRAVLLGSRYVELSSRCFIWQTWIWPTCTVTLFNRFRWQ